MRPGRQMGPAHGESRRSGRAPNGRGRRLTAAAGLLAGVVLAGAVLAAGCSRATEPVSEAAGRAGEVAAYLRELGAVRERFEAALRSAEAAVRGAGAQPDATWRRASTRVEAAAKEAGAATAALARITPPRGLEGAQADAKRSLDRATASLEATAADLAERRRGLSRSQLQRRLRTEVSGALSRLLATLTAAARSLAPAEPSPAP